MLGAIPPGPVWAALDQHCAPEPVACLDTVLKGPLTLEEADSPGFFCASGDAGSTLNPPDHPMQPTLDLPSLLCQLPSHPVLYQLPAQPLNSGSLHLIPTPLDHVSPPYSHHPQGQAQTLQCGLSSLPSSLPPPTYTLRCTPHALVPLCLPPQAGLAPSRRGPRAQASWHFS